MKRNQHIYLGPLGASGAYILRGTKYTMARATAQTTVTWLARKHQSPLEKSQSARLPIDGGDLQDLGIEIEKLRQHTKPRLNDSALTQLHYHFGSNAIAVLELGAQGSNSYEFIPGTDMPATAIDYAVSHKWMQSLADLLLRRLELRASGRLRPETAEFCYARLARLLHWDEAESSRQRSLLQQSINCHFQA